MPKLKTADLVNSIAQLGTQRAYGYYSGNTKIRITDIAKPEGPIKFVRWDSRKSEADATTGSISINQLTILMPSSLFAENLSFRYFYEAVTSE